MGLRAPIIRMAATILGCSVMESGMVAASSSMRTEKPRRVIGRIISFWGLDRGSIASKWSKRSAKIEKVGFHGDLGSIFEGSTKLWSGITGFY